MIGKYFVLLAIIGVTAAVTPVPVSIYYETLCEDSMQFFTKQFEPTWRDLKAYISPLQLIPYGKTTSSPATQSQNPVFTCHHGPNECSGNKLQSCLLDDNTYHYTKDQQINFINCLMTNATKNIEYKKTAESCKKDTGVDVTLIIACADSRNGENLLLENGRKTNLLQNPLTSVPTVVLNNKFNKDESDEATKSFRATLCKYITENPKPAACSVSGAPITMIGVLTLLTAGLFVHLL